MSTENSQPNNLSLDKLNRLHDRLNELETAVALLKRTQRQLAHPDHVPMQVVDGWIHGSSPRDNGK